MVDDVYKKKLGVSRIGEVFEINGHRARVVGFTHDIRSFTTSPCVFTSFRNALDYVPIDRNQTTYLLVKTAAVPTARDREGVFLPLEEQVRRFAILQDDAQQGSIGTALDS